MTASPARINFKLYTYATFSETTTLHDALGDPINLTGKVARCQIRRDHGAADALFTLTTENGGIELGGLAGTVTLRIDVPDTNLELWDDSEAWPYDLLIIDTVATPDVIDRTFQGYIFAINGVTRPATP
jgi:hypothetical protein